MSTPAHSTEKGLAGLLLDLDGVLYIGDQLVPGAIKAMEEIQSSNIPCRFITNTSTLTAASLADKLGKLGFSIEPDEIFSAVSATKNYLRQHGKPSLHLVVSDSVRDEFSEFPQGKKTPDFIVMGDIAEKWDYQLLNQVFNEMMEGSQLLSMHKNRYWQTEKGLQMDVGAFVAGLEYATEREATVIGKPSVEFFDLARQSFPTSGPVMVVGDDIENDIAGGQDAGCMGVLVKTGKYRKKLVTEAHTLPSSIIDSIADLPGLLRSRNYL